MPSIAPAAMPEVTARITNLMRDASARAQHLETIGNRMLAGDPGSVLSLGGRLNALTETLDDLSHSAARAGNTDAAELVMQMASPVRRIAAHSALAPGTKTMPLAVQGPIAQAIAGAMPTIRNSLSDVTAADLLNYRVPRVGDGTPPEAAAPQQPHDAQGQPEAPPAP